MILADSALVLATVNGIPLGAGREHRGDDGGEGDKNEERAPDGHGHGCDEGRTRVPTAIGSGCRCSGWWLVAGGW